MTVSSDRGVAWRDELLLVVENSRQTGRLVDDEQDLASMDRNGMTGLDMMWVDVEMIYTTINCDFSDSIAVKRSDDPRINPSGPSAP